jgi:hypothetical protein
MISKQEAARRGNDGAAEEFQNAPQTSIALAQRQAALAAMTEIFSDRCEAFAERVRLGNLHLVEAVDCCQSAADISGLSEMLGIDEVQAILRAAFMTRTVPR